MEKSIIDNCKLVSAQVEQLSKDQTEIIKKQLTAIDKGLEEVSRFFVNRTFDADI